MKVPGGYACTDAEIAGDFDGPSLDWTIYADCLDCPAHWRGEYGEDDDAVRFRVDAHIEQTGHRVSWMDAEQEFYGRDPLVIADSSRTGKAA